MTKAELVAILKAMRETATDEVALRGMELYPWYDSVVNTYQKKGARVRFKVGEETFLYKLTCEDQTENGTLILENWTPTDAPAIWTGIDVEHEGTLTDPIPVTAGGMEYVCGKYYIENDVIYICKRIGANDGDVFDLDHTPSQLVGHYFEIVE